MRITSFPRYLERTRSFSQINIVGTATLDGSLIITFTNGFEPIFADTFKIMTFGSRVGEFSFVSDLDLGNGKVFVADYDVDSVRLTAAIQN